MSAPATPTIRRIGALSLVLGLLLSYTAISVGAPAGAAPTATPVCNNQSPAGPNCVGTENHGTVTAEIQSDGNLTFTFAGNANITGWNDIKICIPQVAKTNSADCRPQDPEILLSSQYSLVDVTNPQPGSKNIAFDCDKNFSAIVDKSAFPSGTTPSYTVHLSVCNGGTDEAFGTADAFVAPTTTSSSTSSSSTSSSSTSSTSTSSTSTTSTSTTTTTAPTTTTTTTAPTTTTAAGGGTPTTAGGGGGGTPTTAGGTGGNATGATVAGVVLSRETGAAAPTAAPSIQVSPVAIARTGFASPVLLALGVALMLLGYFAVTIGGRRELVPALAVPASTTPPRAEHGHVGARPLALLAGLLAVGMTLGKHRR